MRRTVVYVVAGEGNDFYSAMTRVSAASLRVTNPAVKIVLVTDQLSADSFRRCRDPLLSEIDDCLVFQAPRESEVFRSRFIRTNLRNLIDGQYLVLDSDMLVRDDLSELFSSDADIVCAPNHSSDQFHLQISREDQDTLSAMGWNVRRDVYVNGGLMLCNDSSAARRFAADWHKKWISAHNRTGRYRDQPALNSALHATSVSLAVLPHRFNAQFKKRAGVANSAAIWHFYASAKSARTTAFEEMVGRLLKGETFDRAGVETMIRRLHPWRRGSPIDDWMARRVQVKGRLGSMELLWFSRLQGIRFVARQMRRRLTGLWRSQAAASDLPSLHFHHD